MSKHRAYNDRGDELCYRCGKQAKFVQQVENKSGPMFGGWWSVFKCECGQEIQRPTGDPQPDELTW